jgi:hypothetical protein
MTALKEMRTRSAIDGLATLIFAAIILTRCEVLSILEAYSAHNAL